MNLEKFSKNKRQKQVIIFSVIGIFLIIGCIILYKTYAYYEEKKTFNVLQGTVPEFNTSDIELALTLDGEKVDNIPKINNNDNGGYAKIEADCKDTADIIWDIDEWGPNIRNIRSSKVQCNIYFETFYNSVNIGDYVSYTPSSTNYTITRDLTGYSDDQTINPSELNLWRVIRKNDDGTIDMVSEYVSSNKLYLYGYTGYKNSVGLLNEIAKQYETEGITSGSIYIGYNGQTEYCTDYSIEVCPPDSTSSVPLSNSSISEINLVESILGNLIGYVISDKTVASSYWLALRAHHTKFYVIKRIDEFGSGVDAGNDLVNSTSQRYVSNALRPIVTLKSGITATGLGTEESPWKVN